MSNVKSASLDVSIIMPVYNGEAYLDKSINSVLNQTFDNFELILIDDNSTDKSLKICEEYAMEDSRIRVYSAEENKGTFVGHLEMYESVLRKYIMCLDQDDWLEPDAIEKAYKAIIDNDADIVVFGYYINEMTESKFELNDDEVDNKTAICKLMIDRDIQSYFWNKIYKKEVFVKGHKNWPNDYETFEDFSVMPFIFENARKVKIIEEKLYHYYQNPNNFSNKTKKNLLNYYLSRSYWIRVGFLEEKYPDVLLNNHALNKAFENTLGVWKSSFLNNDKNKRKYAERMIVTHKQFLNMTNIGLAKKIVLKAICLLN